MIDPIADLLTRLRNAIRANHESVEISNSRLKEDILEILKKEGYIDDFSVLPDKRQGILKVYLKYHAPKKNVIKGLKQESKPGRRIYLKSNKIPRVVGGLGTAIITTSKGIVTDNEARKLKVGGELICTLW